MHDTKRHLSLVLFGLLLYCTGCGKDYETQERAKSALVLKTCGFMLANYAREHGEVVFPDDIDVTPANALNRKLVERLNAPFLRTEGFVKNGLLVDGWGRPLVVQKPDRWPEGVLCTTADGPKVIRPLPEGEPPDGVWPADAAVGGVQFWSLGSNGKVDRGDRDDIVLPFHIPRVKKESPPLDLPLPDPPWDLPADGRGRP